MADKKLKINVVVIQIEEASEEASGGNAVFYVKHYDPRQAKAWLLENRVFARVASQDDVIEMVNEGVTPIGPFEKQPTALDSLPNHELALPPAE